MGRIEGNGALERVGGVVEAHGEGLRFAEIAQHRDIGGEPRRSLKGIDRPSRVTLLAQHVTQAPPGGGVIRLQSDRAAQGIGSGGQLPPRGKGISQLMVSGGVVRVLPQPILGLLDCLVDRLSRHRQKSGASGTPVQVRRMGAWT